MLTPRSDGGFRFNSPDNLRQTEVHRKATWKWIRGLGGRLVEGINLTKVSLPVEIFEDRSFLQRLPDSWAQFDLVLEAAECADRSSELCQHYVAQHCATFRGAGSIWLQVVGSTGRLQTIARARSRNVQT